MSFGRAAGGGLSINTGTANSLFSTSGDPNKTSMFGASTQASQGGGLFGAVHQQNQAQPSGGLFGTSHTQKSGLFGSGNQPPPSQPSGSLFGQSAAHPQPSLQGGSLFGMANTQQTQPQHSGGVLAGFGGQPSQPQPSGGSLAGFGGPQSQQQSQQQQQQQQQPPQLGSSLFGMNNQQSQAQSSGGLFRGLQLGQTGGTSGPSLHLNQNSMQNRPPQSGGLFPPLGASMTQSTQTHAGPGSFSSTAHPAGTLGGSLGGSGPAFSNLQTQPVATGVKIDLNHARLTTRFTDLHDDLQREIEHIDALVLRQISGYHQCQGLMPTHGGRMEYLPNDVTYVERRLKDLHESLESDAQAVDRLRTDAKRDIEDARLCFAAIDHLKLLPQHQAHGLFMSPRMPTSLAVMHGHGGRGGDRPRDLIALIGQRADGMAQTLQAYQRNLAEVEAHLGTVEVRTAEQMQQLAFRRGSDGLVRPTTDQLHELAGVLRDFEHGIVRVADQVGTVRDALRELTLATDLVGGSYNTGDLAGRITNGRGGR